MASQVSLGVLALGVALRVGHAAVARSGPDAVVRVAWSVSVSLGIASLILLAIGLFTAGLGVTEGVVLAVHSLGVLGGLLHGSSAALWRSPPTPSG